MANIDALQDEQRQELETAISKINYEMLKGLDYGEEQRLTENYVLSHYCDNDVIVVVLEEEWEEIYQVLFNPKDQDGKIIFETL